MTRIATTLLLLLALLAPPLTALAEPTATDDLRIRKPRRRRK